MLAMARPCYFIINHKPPAARSHWISIDILRLTHLFASHTHARIQASIEDRSAESNRGSGHYLREAAPSVSPFHHHAAAAAASDVGYAIAWTGLDSSCMCGWIEWPAQHDPEAGVAAVFAGRLNRLDRFPLNCPLPFPSQPCWPASSRRWCCSSIPFPSHRGSSSTSARRRRCRCRQSAPASGEAGGMW